MFLVLIFGNPQLTNATISGPQTRSISINIDILVCTLGVRPVYAFQLPFSTVTRVSTDTSAEGAAPVTPAPGAPSILGTSDIALEALSTPDVPDSLEVPENFTALTALAIGALEVDQAVAPNGEEGAANAEEALTFDLDIKIETSN